MSLMSWELNMKVYSPDRIRWLIILSPASWPKFLNLEVPHIEKRVNKALILKAIKESKTMSVSSFGIHIGLLRYLTYYNKGFHLMFQLMKLISLVLSELLLASLYQRLIEISHPPYNFSLLLLLISWGPQNLCLELCIFILFYFWASSYCRGAWTALI